MATKSSSTIPGWAFAVGGVAVLALALLVAWLTAGEGGDRPSVAEIAGAPVVEGETLPVAGDPADDPSVGQPAPTVQGEGFDGEPITIGESEQPELLVFMAAWCPHCQDELTELVAFVEDGRVPDDVRLTAVVTGLDDTRDNWPPDAWFEDEGWTGPVIVDDADSSIAEAYGQPGTPYWVAIDGDGQIAARVSGRLPMETVDLVLDDLAGTA